MTKLNTEEKLLANNQVFGQYSRKLSYLTKLKGEVRRFFLFVQSFYRPKTKTSFNRQFSPKSERTHGEINRFIWFIERMHEKINNGEINQ